MTAKSLALTGTVGALAIAGSATAAFTGLKCEVFVGDGWVENGYSGLVAYRLFANFDGAVLADPDAAAFLSAAIHNLAALEQENGVGAQEDSSTL